MEIRELEVDRVNEFKVKVNEKRAGVFRKIYNSEVLVFKSKDEAD